MVEPISQTRLVPTAGLIPKVEFTTAKISQIALAVLATAAFITATATISLGGIVSVFIALPIYALSAAFALTVFNVKDYENRLDLTSYRAQAQREPLETTLQKHPLAKINQYEILTPKEFKEKLEEYCKELSVNEILDFYEKIGGNKYETTKLAFKALIDDRLKTMSACTIFDQCINKLTKYSFVGEALTKAYDDYLEAKQAYSAVYIKHDQATEQELLEALADVEKVVDGAQPVKREQVLFIANLKEAISTAKQSYVALIKYPLYQLDVDEPNSPEWQAISRVFEARNEFYIKRPQIIAKHAAEKDKAMAIFEDKKLNINSHFKD